jgi:hypothetical protein
VKIYVMVWNTESGDHGIAGYWRKNPPLKYRKAYIAENWPDEVAADTFNYFIQELTEIEL